MWKFYSIEKIIKIKNTCLVKQEQSLKDSDAMLSV